MEFVDILARIRDVYQMDVADLPSGNLLEILKRWHDRSRVIEKRDELTAH